MAIYKELVFLDDADNMDNDNIMGLIKANQYREAIDSLIVIASNFDYFDCFDTEKDGNPYNQPNYPWGNQDHIYNFGKYTLSWNLGLNYCALSELESKVDE